MSNDLLAASQDAQPLAIAPKVAGLTRYREVAGEFVRSVLVGVVAAAADCAILFFCNEQLGWHYSIAATLGFLVGVSINYVLSLIAVFKQGPRLDQASSFAVFVLLGFVGLGLTQLLLMLQINHLGMGLRMAKLVTIGLVFGWNFSARKYFLFSGSR